MIPIKLELKNFLSYGSSIQTIDFGSYPLICLCGKNGHGKSALLDAMTWVVWGQARKLAGAVKADANLLRLGQTQMMVSFEFSFNSQHYRVRREYSKTYGKPVAQLDFGLVDATNGQFISLTDKTIRSTQEKIISTLGLDYDAFINSAFLRQGQSNEFSKKSPKERKEIICTVLGLDKFDMLRKRALEKIRDTHGQIEQLNRSHEKTTQDLLRLPEVTEDLKKISKQLDELDTQFNNHDQEIVEHKKATEVLIKKQQDKHVLDVSKEQTVRAKRIETEKIIELVAQWRKINRMLKDLPNIKKVEAELQLIQKRVEDHQKKLQTSLEIKEKILKEKEVQQEYVQKFSEVYRAKMQQQQLAISKKETDATRLITELKSITHRLKEINAQGKELAVQLKENQVQLSKIAIDDKSYAKEEVAFEKKKTIYHAWVAQANAKKSELQQLQQKKSFTEDASNPSCPLCEQNLSASRKKFLNAQFIKAHQRLLHQMNRFKRIIPALKEQLVGKHQELQTNKKLLNQKNVLLYSLKERDKTTAELNKQSNEIAKKEEEILKQIEQINQQIKHEQATLKLIEQNEKKELANDKTFTAMKERLSTLQKNFEASAYIVDVHKKDAAELKVLQEKHQSCQQADQEQKVQAKRKEELFERCTAAQKIKKEMAELDEKLKNFSEIEKEAANLAAAEKKLETRRIELQKEKDSALQKKGQLEQESKTLEKQKKESSDSLSTVKKLKEVEHEYQILSTALSKDGIQALLIEEAIPEIEHEANALLAQLTDNQAQIMIESLRDLKKGGTKETLDIKISDAVGIRPYEMFSGGEAFRIDFALRIAISKLLARRAGTSLQTLIIDEGFGSQDEEGLQHIMDAIHRIQDNFHKVIIVSHLPAMKEQFPVHFLVEKGANGSNVHVIEQG